MPAPLVHLRVVDLTDLRGALAGRLLADLGADVVKVEPPRGDPGRLVPPFAGGVAAPDRSLPFLYRNANKRGAVLDLHDAGGWHRFCELCERADVLIENLGALAELAERSEEHTSELQSRQYLVCRLLLEKKRPWLRGVRRRLLHTPTASRVLDRTTGSRR